MPKGIAHSRKRRLLHGIETPLRTRSQRRRTRILSREEHAPDASSLMARIERQQRSPKM
jgi:hypothetical protein